MMSECGYIDCCPVPDKDKRIEELEAQLEEAEAYKPVSVALMKDNLELNKRITELEATIARVEGLPDRLLKVQYSQIPQQQLQQLAWLFTNEQIDKIGAPVYSAGFMAGIEVAAKILTRDIQQTLENDDDVLD